MRVNERTFWFVYLEVSPAKHEPKWSAVPRWLSYPLGNIWRVPWGAWFQSLKTRSPQGNLDMNLFKIKLRRYRRKQNQLWNQVAQHWFVSKWAWIKSYLPSLGYYFAHALALVSDWLWGWSLIVPKGLCGPKFAPPSKQRTSNQRSAQALHSIRFVFWPVLHILKQFCVMHDACKEMFSHLSPDQFNVLL